MRHYPTFLDLHGRTALVLGTGEVGQRKAALLARAGAELRMRDYFDPGDLDGCAVAIGADAAEADLLALSRTAQARGIPVNIVDRPALGSFISPSVIDRDPVTIAVSTAGTAPVLARLLRQRIEAVVPPGFGRLAALAGRLSATIRARFPDTARRRRVLERILAGPAADLMLAGDAAAAERAAEAEIGRGAPAQGIVHLVGAGPGSADLLTLRALRLLGEADVVVHDRLVSDEVLDMARRDAERIFVGKARANHCMAQEEINALLVRLAQAGRRVVRLKGGDPFVFGRGGEEAAALRDAGVAFEVVPGITAALACAADAGIPLTHRGLARTVTFATGHTRDGLLDLDFEALAAGGGTLVLYMGLHALAQIRQGLIAAGMAAATPAALVEHGGTAARRILRGTLDDLPARAAAWHAGGPVLLLIGAAVAAQETASSLPAIAKQETLFAA
jgi:uroporphyrin-III C-methyltransferase/precorrin-2 dehydrogenase/sirohydrochlorin ferrochelatase